MTYNKPTILIEAAAAKALAHWKGEFADNVAIKAKEIADKSGSPGLVTVLHYRQAAREAVQMLARALEGSDLNDGHKEAA